jgi:hypothetical protein
LFFERQGQASEVREVANMASKADSGFIEGPEFTFALLSEAPAAEMEERDAKKTREANLGKTNAD